MQLFPLEEARLTKINQLVSSGTDVFSRKNFIGHITAGCLVFNAEKKVLMVHHNIYKKYFAPSGHVDPEDKTIYDGALREVAEETGIESETVLQWAQDISIPIYIDTHYIPENPKKNESEHYHTEFLYLLKVDSDDVTLQEQEVSDYAWFAPEEYIGLYPDQFQAQALQKVIDLGIL